MKVKKTKKSKGGGFQSMGLDPVLMKGILHRGYKLPTPIQRKCIPLALQGCDLVAMARTGSGKTAAFLLPLFNRLLQDTVVKDTRGLILTPTRELAHQTLKFIKDLGKYTKLRSCLVVGGESMEDQFALLHSRPEIIVATPGRFLHLLIEMQLCLSKLEVLILDEADRLFELGFQEQLNDIIKQIPIKRQTLLFSATMPKALADFTQAGLKDPVLVRLDLETKLSENLQLSFIKVRSEDKLAHLLYLLSIKVKADAPTLVFVATRHHVELLKEILVRNGHCCSYLYGSLDPIERKIQAANFREGKTNVLVVTDVAARGIDIPLLECVIHYHFPATPKLFVHRSGRVARAGRHGTAYALVAPDELPYMLDLHLYLGRPIASTSASETPDANFFWCVSEGILEPFRECYSDLHSRSTDVQSLFRVCQNAMQMYLRSRQKPSTESVRRAKELLEQNFGAHPDFSSAQDTTRETFLAQVKNFRPSQTIFEYKKIKHPSNELLDLMKLKRKQHDASIQRRKRERTAGKDTVQPPSDGREKPACELNIVINVPKSKSERSEFFIPYRPSNYYQEKGLRSSECFQSSVCSQILDLTQDEVEQHEKPNNFKKWDRKKKKFVGVEEDKKKKRIKNEAGVWISASYNTHKYKEWKEKHNIGHSGEVLDHSPHVSPHGRRNNLSRVGCKGVRARNELKTKEVILKERRRKEKIRNHIKKVRGKKLRLKKK